VVDQRGKVITSGRNLRRIKSKFERASSLFDEQDPALVAAREKWERAGLKKVSDLPEFPAKISVRLTGRNHAINLFPAIVAEKDDLCAIRLLLSNKKAVHESSKGIQLLIANELNDEFKYLHRNCLPQGLKNESYFYLGGKDSFKESLFAFLRRELIGYWDRVPSRQAIVERASKLRGTIYKKALPIIDQVKTIIVLFVQVQEEIAKIARSTKSLATGNSLTRELEDELKRLVPGDFPLSYSKDSLVHLPRYLKALKIRVQRAGADPSKDRTKKKQIEPFLDLLGQVHQRTQGLEPDITMDESIKRFSMLLEEFRVSVFAPELGTVCPVSQKRVLKAWDELALELSCHGV